MPQFLALTIDESLVRGIVADVSAGRVDARKTFEVHSPTPLLTGDQIQNQAWLRETLKQQGISAEQVLVSVTRNAAIVRRLDLPAVPVAELPTFVGFQARTKLAQPFDTLMWDFLPAPQANVGVAVLLSALPKSQFNALINTLTGAGLKPVQVGITTASLAEYATHGRPPLRSPQAAPLMVIHLEGERLEIGLLQQGILTATHGYHLSHEDPPLPQVLTEITRASMAFQKLLPPGSSPQVMLSAADSVATELSAAIAGRFGQPPELLPLPSAVRMLDSAAASPTSSFVEPIGQLLTQAGFALPTINLLAPRRTQPKKDYSRRRLVILGIGVLAILGTGGGLYAMQWSDASQKVAQLQKDEEKLNVYLKRAEPTLKSGQAVESWQQMKVDWIDELKQFSTVLPPGDKLFLTNIQMKGIATPNPIHRGMITLNGSAKQRDDVIKLEMDAVNVPDRYQVLPHTVKTRNVPQGNQEGQPQGNQNQNNPYPIEFDLTLNLNVPKKSAAKPASSAPAKPGTATPAATTPPATTPTKDNKPVDSKPATENKTPPPENKTPPATPTAPTTPTTPPADAPKSSPATPAATPAQPANPPAAPAVAPASNSSPATPQAAPATGAKP